MKRLSPSFLLFLVFLDLKQIEYITKKNKRNED